MAWQSFRINRKYMYLINFFLPICVFARTAIRSLFALLFLLAPAHLIDLPIYRILSHNSLPKSKAIAIQLFITHFILQNQNIHIHGTSKFTPCFYACVSTLSVVYSWVKHSFMALRRKANGNVCRVHLLQRRMNRI